MSYFEISLMQADSVFYQLAFALKYGFMILPKFSQILARLDSVTDHFPINFTLNILYLKPIFLIKIFKIEVQI